MEEVAGKMPEEYVGFPTARGVAGYAESFGMSRQKFLDWLKSKNKVLDVGAGGGVLEKEIGILKKKEDFEAGVEITPLDIIYGTREGADFLRYSTRLALKSLKRPIFRKSIQEVDRDFVAGAVGGSFTKLPFLDASFDGILASFSFGVHARDKEQLMKSYAEVYRVLKPDGEAFVSVLHGSGARGLRGGKKEGSFAYSLDELQKIGFITTLHSFWDTGGGRLTRLWCLILRKK